MDEVEQNIFVSQWRRQINYLPKPKAAANNQICEILAKACYFAITELNNRLSLSFDHQVCFLMNIFGKRSDMPFFTQQRLQEGEKRTFVYAISRILFVGHVAGFRPMKWRENLHRIILKDHSIFPLLIISLIIITFCFDVSLLLVTLEKRKGLKTRGRGEGGGVAWVNFCLVCAAGLSEPLPLYSLFCGQM